MPAYLFLPKNKQPPYEGIVYMPGAASMLAGNSANLRDTPNYDYVVVSGRAVLYPIYAGTYERNTGQTSGWPQKTRAYEEWMVKVSNDARRAVDYLQSRPDIRADDIAYVATSWGAAVGTRTLALEPRFKTAVLLDGGFPQESKVLPELDALNYVTRVTLPVLMINGDSDLIFPLELGQKPYFHLLGTPPSTNATSCSPAAITSSVSSGARLSAKCSIGWIGISVRSIGSAPSQHSPSAREFDVKFDKRATPPERRFTVCAISGIYANKHESRAAESAFWTEWSSSVRSSNHASRMPDREAGVPRRRPS